MRLTDIAIRALPAPEKGARIYFDDTLSGFGVRVSQGGAKAFTLTFGSGRERVTIGRYPIISLADARVEAKRMLAEQTLGKNRLRRLSYEEALDLFVSTHCAKKNRPSTAKETERVLRGYFPALAKKALEDITTHHITDVTDKLIENGRESMAAHAYTAIRSFLRWCVRRRYLSRNPIEGLEAPVKPVSRERVLSGGELGEVVAAAQQLGVFGKFTLMLIYTGQRRGEIAALDASWIDREQQLIALPRQITKNNRNHCLPYGDAVADILETLPREGLLFGARGSALPISGFSKGKKALDNKCRITEPWTLHDLRRTFATGLQRLGVRLEVTEALLNHVSGTRSGIVGVYQRHNYLEEMRTAIVLWESHIDSLLKAS
jgi:integrase